MSSHEDFMRMAIAATREGIANGQTPFGACIVRDGQVLATGHNRVWADTDITAHGEIVTIRRACRALGTVDLSGCTIYSTCEPCPMCFAAIHWARLDHLYYGARIEDALRAGFNELHLSNDRMKELGRSPVQLHPDLLRDACATLFDEWLARPSSRAY